MSEGIRTFEAVFEGGYLRPLIPVEGREGQIYIVTAVDLNILKRKKNKHASLRGKYRGCLSSTEEFSRKKIEEKKLEL